MVKLGKNHPYVASVPKQNRCATCNIRPRGYQVIHVYGNIANNLTIVDGQELIIDTTVIIDVGITLLIQQGAKLTITNTGGLYNNGTLSVETGAIFINNGTFTNGTPPPVQLLQSQQNQFSMTSNSSLNNFSLNNYDLNPINYQKYIDDNNAEPAYEHFNFNKVFQYYLSNYDLGPEYYKAVAENPISYRFNAGTFKAVAEDPISYFFNAGTFINAVGATCINAANGIISNSGLFNNTGAVDNTGTIDNSGLLDNNNGLINNTNGTINNTGAVTNSGTGEINGGTYNGNPPSGNPIIPPSGGPLVGNIISISNNPNTLPIPVYWSNGNIDNTPSELLVTGISSPTTEIYAISVSSNNIIVGWYNNLQDNSPHAIVWSSPTTIPLILTVPDGFHEQKSGCNAISYDGKIIIGSYTDQNSNHKIACIWTVNGPTSYTCKNLAYEDTHIVSNALTCNSDASIIYGIYVSENGDPNNPTVCKWEYDGVSEYIRTDIPHNSSEPFTPFGIVDTNTLFGSSNGRPELITYLNITTGDMSVVTTIQSIPLMGINRGTTFYGIGFTIDPNNNPTFNLLQIINKVITQIAIPSYITNTYPLYNFLVIGFLQYR